MKNIILLISSTFLFSFSCKSSKQTTESSASSNTTVAENPHPETAPDNSGNPEKQNNNSYRLIISFISIGEGTDRDARQIFDNALADWEKNKMKDGSKIEFETVPWGREGEVDFCFTLKEMNPKAQELLINDLREKFKGHQLIQFTENEPCRHKR